MQIESKVDDISFGRRKKNKRTTTYICSGSSSFSDQVNSEQFIHLNL